MTDQETTQFAARLSALEIEIADLKRSLTPPAPKVAPARVIEEGTRVLYPTPAASCDLPTPAELQSLRTLVIARYPRLAPNTTGRWADMESQEFENGFSAAFKWLATVGRSEQPNYKFAISYWVSAAENWARTQPAMTSIISGNGLLVAAIGWSVGFVEADNVGNSWALSLLEHGGKMPTASSWKRILASGEVIKPSPGRFRDAPSPSRVRMGFAN